MIRLLFIISNKVSIIRRCTGRKRKNENLITRKENVVGGKKKISGILQGSLIKTYIRGHSLLVPCTLHVAIKGKGSY